MQCLTLEYTSSYVTTWHHSLGLNYCSGLPLVGIVLSADPPWLLFPPRKTAETPTASPGHPPDSEPKIQTHLPRTTINIHVQGSSSSEYAALTFILNKVDDLLYILERHQLYVFVCFVGSLSKCWRSFSLGHLYQYEWKLPWDGSWCEWCNLLQCCH